MMQEREAAWNEGHAVGEKEGRAAGEKEGRREGIRAVALKMIRQGYTDEQIIALCEISPEEITEYRKSIL